MLGHADGICHLFVDNEANLDMALSVALDSKIQYPAACNSIETLLVHKDIASTFLEKAIPFFNSKEVKLIGDKRSVELGVKYQASPEDWQTEYLDLILSIKIVDGLKEAIIHIQEFSSKHTDGIITDNLNTANKYLDRLWTVEGIVKKGRQLGKTIGFPTCNIEMQNYVIPKLGVYAVKVNLLSDNKIYKGIANLGLRPTFNQKKILLEVNIFNFNKKIYGKRIRVEFVKFIRGEKKFKNINYLKKQIKLDIKKAKKIN